MQNPRPGYPDRGGSSGPIRSLSRLGHCTPSPSPYTQPHPEDDKTVPDSQEETIRLPAVFPPPTTTDRNRAYFKKAIRGVPNLASAAIKDRGAPFCKALIRSLLGAIITIAETAGLAPLLSLLRNHPEFGEVVTAIETEAIETWSSTHPMPPNDKPPRESGFERIFGDIPTGKRPEDPTPTRLTAIENTLAQVLYKPGSYPTSSAPKGKGGPEAPQSTSEAPASGQVAQKAASALPPQAQSYAAATTNPRRFNPSPKEPLAFRKKKHDEQRFGEVLFTPSPAFPKDNDANCPLSGSGALKNINEFLGKLTPPCSIKGLVWTPRGNVLLTPTSPDQWDILAKQGASALSHLHNGRSFHCLTHGPSRDLVVHGIPAKATDLPKVDDVCLSLAAGLTLDPHDIIQSKSRWLVSSRSPNPNKRPLFLLSLTTDEVADRLLHRNPHWIEGDRITFKEFSTVPTVPNQCCRCWKVGHPTWRCGVSNAVCAICAEFHDTLTHKAAQPPKKKASPPQPKKAAPGSPVKATADFIHSIPPGSPGHPIRDITQYKDIELVKKFCAWCLYNKLPVIGPNDDPLKWAPPLPLPINCTAFLPTVTPKDGR
ncbi:hypothetical protein BOTBODRAFT_177966 [Botryobasidium botryosum FD-172 SS1]|uniref:Uncharacterized protein n=1 Tax=Botryobasidium botryosum (strain FD-172 SS1) TaxID=930990 RepID=A0A067M7J3_BOTB1|nr:hypothetical protein BOTBODRAFT_177966 [Botryobasidium botryosum FD-172 SS1]